MATKTQATNSVTWHTAVLWGLGGIAMIALAGPAPNIATLLVVILIVLVLLKNWPVYASFLNLPGGTTNG